MSNDISLYPLSSQSEHSQLEQEIRESFLSVFDEMLGSKIRNLLQLGSPWLIDDLSLLQKWYNAEAIAMPNAENNTSTLQYLLKSWHGEDKKRGFHFLRTYLTALYQNGFSIEQLWQEAGAQYPTVLRTKDEAEKTGLPHWLTSRVRVEITNSKADETIAEYYRTIQVIIGARFLVDIVLLKELHNKNNLLFGTAFSVANSVDISLNFVAPLNNSK